MPGVKNDGKVRVVGLFGELTDQGVHAGIVLVNAFDNLEAGIAQRGRNKAGIVRWIGQGDGINIFAVADDQRDALAAGRGSLDAERGQDHENESSQEDGERFHGSALHPVGARYRCPRIRNFVSDKVASARKGSGRM